MGVWHMSYEEEYMGYDGGEDERFEDIDPSSLGDFRYMFDEDGDGTPAPAEPQDAPPSILVQQKSKEEIQLILDELNSGLNPSQREAAETIYGPVIIIAGAGAGKTKTLTNRVATMLIQGIHPANIMLVTFTNKAAEEIRNRIEEMVGENAQYITAGTFHSTILRHVLKKYPESRYLRAIGLDMEMCANIDQDESEKLLKEAIDALSPEDREQMAENEWDHKDFEKEMGKARALGQDINDYRALTARGSDDEELRKITANCWQIYNRLCREVNGIDFDDILLFADKMLRSEPSIADELGDRFKYVMLDEYQDTNRVQMNIMDSICKKHKNICVVGDEKQSIYGFREADIKIILSFKNRYPESKSINMNQNYRSYSEILRFSNACADAMEQKLSDGQLIPMKQIEESPAELEVKKSNKVVMAEFRSGYDEAEMVAKAIRRDLMLKTPGKEVALLYRNRNSKMLVERQLVDMNIPYRVVGDASFFQKKEVKDIVGMIRFVFHPWDTMAGYRFLGATSVGISLNAAKKAASEGHSVHDFLTDQATKRLKAKKKDEITDLTVSAKKIAPFMELGKMLREAISYGDNPAFIKEVIGKLWDIYLRPGVTKIANRSDDDNDLENRTDNAEYVIDRLGKNLEKGMLIDEIIEDLTMMVENNPDTDKNLDSKVVLMTIHGSKGLEFDNVYMVGMNELTMVGEDPTFDEIEESRRLNYVGMTRAKKKLTMTFATFIVQYGQLIETKASRFIEEIEDRLKVRRYVFKSKEKSNESSMSHG